MNTDIHFKRYVKNDPKQIKKFDFYKDGHKQWYLNNKIHRENGPAVIFFDKTREWWLEGEWYPKKEYDLILTSRAKKL